MMLDMRERLAHQVGTLRQESLQSREEIVTSEDGTDAFDRQFALTVASSEQDAIFDIDDAIRRLDAGSYGVCEACGCGIEKPRLKALPFVRLCIACQSESERSRPRFRPLE
jgi:RNA polymerase-binding transcription factor DksA